MKNLCEKVCFIDKSCNVFLAQRILLIKQSGLNVPWQSQVFHTLASIIAQKLWNANGSAHLSSHSFVTGSQAGRDFMQILIFLTKARKKKELMGSLSDASTYRAQSVAGCRSFSILNFFASPSSPTRAPFLLPSPSRARVRFPVFSLRLYELTVGRAHLACNFQNVE